jgi:hypothetical protein
MPKLDLTHIAERLQERLTDLKAGKEVAAREIRALLNDEQLTAMDVAWTEQQELRKKKKARTKEEELALGWKTKREICIEVYENALNEANDLQGTVWKKKLRDAEIRQAKIYFESYSKAIGERKMPNVAKNIANNDLTRAGLKRLDGESVGHFNKLDNEVNAMEEALREMLKKN